MLREIKKEPTFSRLHAIVLLIAVALSSLIVGYFLWSQAANADGPQLTIREGVVAASTSATYSPSTPGPVSFNNNGACPRWTGVINSTNLTSNPINSSVPASHFERGTTVTFAIALRNQSMTDAAYDIFLHQSIPDGFEKPNTGSEGANLCVQNGAGTTIAHTTGGTGFFGNTDDDYIELTDPSGGALAASHATSGQDIIVITFDLVVADDYVPGQTHQAIAELMGYSDTNGGDLLAGNTDDVLVTTRKFLITVSPEATDQSFTSSNFAVVGEKATYKVEITVPQATIDNVRLIDDMTNGLIFVSCDAIENSDSGVLSSSISGGITSTCNDPTNPTITNSGRLVEFNLGTLTNSDMDSSTDEKLTFYYTGVVNNDAFSVRNQALNNGARVWWNDNESTQSATIPIIVNEPKLVSLTQVSPNSALKAGSHVTITTTVSHSGASQSDAFNLNFSTSLPKGLAIIPETLQCQIQASLAETCEKSGNTVHAKFSKLEENKSAVITFEATIGSPLAGRLLSLGSSTGWTSLPSTSLIPISSYLNTTVQRTSNTSNPGGANNNYLTASLATAKIAKSNTPSTDKDDDNNDRELANTGTSFWMIIIVAAALIIIASLAGRLLVIRGK